jgi:NhaA family Na+:H+ antiporter
MPFLTGPASHVIFLAQGCGDVRRRLSDGRAAIRAEPYPLSSKSRNGVEGTPPSPPEAWPAAREAAKRLLSPVEHFLAIEASSGIVLLAAAAVALLWANSPWRSAYEALLHTPLGLRVGGLEFERDLHFWVNDGLMVVFFFVVGLEIRRELHGGELSDLRRAALPAFAALGGMLAPAGIYLLLNAGTPTSGGWGVPMATDIAFAVGVLALLGKSVPPAWRILLLALAVIDDVGAIIVIALFYSSGISLAGAAVAVGGVLLVLLMRKLGVRSPWAYLPAALVVWGGTYATGIHPTIAGVVLGLLTPVRAWFGPERFADHAHAAVEAVRSAHETGDGHAIHAPLSDLALARREALSPVERLQHALHGWVAFAIMPLFALANAGVPLGGVHLEDGGGRILLGVALGLALGKPIGVLGLSWLAVRVRAAALPAGMGWSGVLVVALVAGIGFTMALFIASLAFPPGPHVEAAKLGVLSASAVAAVIGGVVGRLLLPRAPAVGAAQSLEEAEMSTKA